MLITGSCGLVGSEAVKYFSDWKTVGVDNNQRQRLFGSDGNTSIIRAHQIEEQPNHTHHDLDITSPDVDRLVATYRPDAVFHCAAQPSHDKAAEDPLLDFNINANGTLNLLEACRNYCPEAPFVFMSTNKVYGDSPNRQNFTETETRYIPERLIDEAEPIDQSMHSLFGVSKASADLLVQEYGRYFGMPTCCLRAGCITGKNHAGAVQHGFLAYLARCFRENRPYTIYGFKGKQVRDIVHARDVCAAVDAFIASPSPAVYNIGGGELCNTSVLEAIAMMENFTGNKLKVKHSDKRKGDHIAYISQLNLAKANLKWSPTWPMQDIVGDLL